MGRGGPAAGRGAAEGGGQVRPGRPDVVRPGRRRAGHGRGGRPAQGPAVRRRAAWSSTSARGIGGDSLALAESGRVIAVDLDQGMARRAAWNAGVYGVGDRVMAVRGRAEGFPIPAGARVHVDPDRRASGRGRARDAGRLRRRASMSLLGLAGSTPGAGRSSSGRRATSRPISAGRASRSRSSASAGECKEATAWFGDLAGPGVRRRATCLPSGATWTDRDGPGEARRRRAGPLGPCVFDPDPSPGPLGPARRLRRRARAAADRRRGRPADRAGPGRLAVPGRVRGGRGLPARPEGPPARGRRAGPGPAGDQDPRGLEIRPEAYRAAAPPRGPEPGDLAPHRRPGRAVPGDPARHREGASVESAKSPIPAIPQRVMPGPVSASGWGPLRGERRSHLPPSSPGEGRGEKAPALPSK